ncbi:hypothetical protein SAMN05428988_3254 [Chitinophaga sp. YR573]|uniref:hypothetical protein n=1 Tax=Chitinophaga sp. YR573 TaxID=1881040 RepID=UPI0008B41FE0|nr:hypothetical protein [Chitinophaga sp. YR573]SEW21829.1 hypothetical protein SAMN05428988_3254 [Chitinophaga sp. YR573]
MKIYAIRNRITGDYVRLGRAQRYIWNHFPTNVIRQNIPLAERANYEVDFYDLNWLEPTRTYTINKTVIR